jgi:hypothetical protein
VFVAAPLAAPPPRRLSARAAAVGPPSSGESQPSAPVDPGQPTHDADEDLDVLGSVVHRAVQAGLLSPAGHRADAVARLLRDEERGRVVDIDVLLQRATAALDRLAAIEGLCDLLSGDSPAVAWRQFEVPFAMRQPDGTVVRGAIDCLVRRTSGGIEVLEFKIARPRPEHDAQLAIYVAAARSLFPGVPVTGRLIYAGQQLSPASGV